MGWISPTGFVDSEGKWTGEVNAYDGDDSTFATNLFANQGAWLELTLATPILTPRVRLFAYTLDGASHEDVGELQIGAYYDAAWHLIYAGGLAKDVYVEKFISDAGEQLVSKIRIKWASGVEDEFRLCELDVRQAVEVEDVSPLSHETSPWANEENARDGEEATFASKAIVAGSWSSYLILTYTGGLFCSKIAYLAEGRAGIISQADVDIYVDGAWINVRSNAYNYNLWTIWSFNIQLVEKVRLRFYNNSGAGATVKLYEVYLGKTTPSAPGYNNCVGLWRMNDNKPNTAVVDSSGGGHDGVADQNTDQLYTAGKIKGAFTHNGSSDHTDIAHHADFNIVDELAIASWIKQTAANKGFILMKDAGDGLTAYYGLHSYGSINRLYFFYGYAGDAVDMVWAVLPVAIDDGTYHFVVVNVNYPDVKFYVDGSFVGSTTLKGHMLTANVPFKIGHGNVYDHHFLGDLDVTILFDDELSDEEIAWLWNEGDGRENIIIPTAPGYANCAAQWRMNDNAANPTVVDKTGNHNGTYHGTGGTDDYTNAHSVAGKINTALDFGGMYDYISLGIASGLMPTAVISICFWVKPNNLGDIGHIYGTQKIYGAWVALTSNERVAFYIRTAAGYNAWFPVTDPYLCPIGEWSFVCCTYDGTTRKIYINGRFIGANTDASGDLDWGTLTDVRIGATDTGTEEFYGSLDNVMIFNKVLTEEEIAWLYNEGNGRENLNIIARPLVGGSLAGRGLAKRGLV